MLLRPFGPRGAIAGAGLIRKLAAIEESDHVITEALAQKRRKPLPAQGGSHHAAERTIGERGSVDHETPSSRKPQIDVA